MAENTYITQQQSIQEDPRTRVLFLGGACVLKEESAPSFDAELKRYADEHAYRCAALDSCGDTTGWLKKQDVDLVSLPCLTRDELAEVRGQISPVVTIGAGENKALANRPEIVSLNGVRLGFLSVGETKLRSGNKYATEADIADAGVFDRVRMLLPQCDHVVVFCRAGLRGAEIPLPEWRERYRRLIGAGASVVLGVSTEPMGWEEYDHGAVFYGLGMLTGNNVDASTGSLAVSMTFERNGRFTYEARLLEARPDTISFSTDDMKKEAINAKNVLLTNEERYLDEAERACAAFYQAEGYETLLSCKTKRGMLSGLLRKKHNDDQRERDGEASLEDLLSDASKRYAVRRALEAKLRLKAEDAK